MALRLTPPTKNIFYLSVLLAIVAIVLYLLGVFGGISGGFAAVAHYAFWIAILGWGLMAAGVAMKGV
jgi:hypothetical protein